MRVNNLVGLHILQHAVLVNAGGMGKGIPSHNGLIGLHRHIHQAGNHAARRINLLCVDISFNADAFVTFKNHGHLFQRSVAGPFANAVDGHFHLTRTVQYTGHGICCGHTQVVVAMRGDNGVMYAIHMFHQVFDFLAIFRRQAIPRRIRDVHHRGTGLDDRLDDTGQILVLRSSRILGIKLHIIHILARILHSGYCPLNNLLAIAVEFILDMLVRSADTRMDTLMFGKFQRICRHVDVLLDSTCQGTNGRPCHCLGYLNHRIEIPWAGNREAGLYHVHTQQLQLFGHLNLLYRVQLTPGNLFSVPQSSVENK